MITKFLITITTNDPNVCEIYTKSLDIPYMLPVGMLVAVDRDGCDHVKIREVSLDVSGDYPYMLVVLDDWPVEVDNLGATMCDFVGWGWREE